MNQGGRCGRVGSVDGLDKLGMSREEGSRARRGGGGCKSFYLCYFIAPTCNIIISFAF